MELLKLVVETTVFTYQDQLYRQSAGFPMGSGISPGACNGYMEQFEADALASCPEEIRPTIWLRYVDDVVEAIKKENVQQFTDHINSQNPKIQFTVETQTTNEKGNDHLPVLDVDIEKQENGSSKFKIYRKSTHTDQYLNFTSHHPLNQKLGVVRTLFDRANALISTEEDRREEIENVKKALRVCKYPNWAFKKVERQMKDAKEKTSGKKKTNNKDRKTTPGRTIVLPYLSGMSETAARIFKKFDRSVSFRPAEKLGQRLFKLKDKADPLKRANSIYEVPWNQ